MINKYTSSYESRGASIASVVIMLSPEKFKRTIY